MIELKLDPKEFTAAGLKGKTLTIFRRSSPAINEWPEYATYGGLIYEFSGVTVVPRENQQHYLGAAEYVKKKQCGFDQAWVGECKKPVGELENFCDHHKETCNVCGEEATHNCSATMGLVCGTNLCSNPMCILKHNLTHSAPKWDSSSRDTREDWFINTLMFHDGLDSTKLEEILVWFEERADELIEMIKKLKHQHKAKEFLEDSTKQREYLTEFFTRIRDWYPKSKNLPWVKYNGRK